MKKILAILTIFASVSAMGQEECVQGFNDGYFPSLEAEISTTNLDCNIFRVAVHIIHSEFLGNPTYDISNEQAESAILGANQAFLNAGHTYDPNGVIMPYMLELDTVTRTNGVEVWGEEYDLCGIQESGGGCGVSPTQIWNHFDDQGFDRDEIINVYVYNKMTNTGVTGFAWLASPDNGVFVRRDRMGDDFYEDDYDQDFPGSPNNTTIIHEFGHMFGLFHTFQATPDCDPEINPAIQGDRIDDTPVETKTFGCSDVCGENSENYMSYRSCKNVFTQGQLNRVGLVINNPGNGFQNYTVCETCDPSEFGDFNNDGFVNIVDFSIMNLHFGCFSGQACYDSKFDFNCDGGINIVDVSYYGQYFNMVIE